MKALLAVSLALTACAVPAPVPTTVPTQAPDARTVKLPGVVANLDARHVDIAAKVCLREGSLELIASTRAGRIHESIVAIQARPTHVHAALLLLGLDPGSPATRKPTGAGGFVDLPPRGPKVDVALVIDGVERPIREFLARTGPKPQPFTTDTFLFAGSKLIDQPEGPALYACEMTGNVISLSTFGDELLCLPGIHTRNDGQLLWAVDPTHLPALGAAVTLRLRATP